MLDKIKKMIWSTPAPVVRDFTVQMLVDRAVEAFKETIEEQSFDDRMMFNCDFQILLAPKVYYKIEVQIPLIAEGIIKRFYKEIQKRKDSYDEYIPLAESWHLLFCPTDFDDTSEDEDVEAKIQIISSSVAIKDWGQLTSEEQNKVSVHGKNSKYSKWNINLDVIKKIDVIEKGRIRMRFDRNAVEGSSSSNSSKITHPKTDEFAKLIFFEGSKKLSFLMKEEKLLVSKAKSVEELSKTDRLVIHTDDRGLKLDHFSIRYDAEARGFSIALYHPANINEQRLPISPKQGREIWHPLTKESAITCGLTQVEFIALK